MVEIQDKMPDLTQNKDPHAEQKAKVEWSLKKINSL